MGVKDLSDKELIASLLGRLGVIYSNSGVSMDRSTRSQLKEYAEGVMKRSDLSHEFEWYLLCGEEIPTLDEMMGETRRRHPRGRPKQLCLFSNDDFTLETAPDERIIWSCFKHLLLWYQNGAKGRPSYEVLWYETQVAEAIVCLCPLELPVTMNSSP